MERVSENPLRRQANTLRKDMNVVGLWETFQRTETGTREVVVVEEVAGRSFCLAIDQKGIPAEIPGKIIKRREQRGHPIRIEAFVPEDGSEEIILADHEF